MKTKGLTLTLSLPPDSLPLLMLNPTRVLKAPPRRAGHVDVGWAYPSLLTWSHVDFGMQVVVVWVYYVVMWRVSNIFAF